MLDPQPGCRVAEPAPGEASGAPPCPAGKGMLLSPACPQGLNPGIASLGRQGGKCRPNTRQPGDCPRCHRATCWRYPLRSNTCQMGFATLASPSGTPPAHSSLLAVAHALSLKHQPLPSPPWDLLPGRVSWTLQYLPGQSNPELLSRMGYSTLGSTAASPITGMKELKPRCPQPDHREQGTCWEEEGIWCWQVEARG